MAEKIYANIDLLSTPEEETHIVNKKYVDLAVINRNIPLATKTQVGGFKVNDTSFTVDTDGFLIFTGEVNADPGKSAYEIAVENGYTSTEYDWLNSLKGKDAYEIWLESNPGKTKAEFLEAIKGEQGDSAFEAWKVNGHSEGTFADFMEAIKGEQGDSAYKTSGFTGTESEWIESLKGKDGKSAYELWKDAGNTGTEADFLAAIKGKDGKDAVSPTTSVEQLSTGAKITITDKNGTTSAEASNGVGITSVVKTSTAGLVDTYTITYTDNSTSTFAITNGAGSAISKLSELDNDTEFITNIVDNLLNYYKKDETYTKSEVDSIISALSGGLTLEVVSNLNSVLAGGNVSSSTIYLVETSEGSGVYTQYLWRAATSSWATLGTTSVDLSNYYNKSEIDTKLSLYASITFVSTLLASYTPTSGLSKVALSNSYNDLDDLPQIPSIDGLATETYVNTAVNGLSDTVATTYRKSADKVPYSDVSDTPTLATVATSGSYNDLADKPTIPNAVTVDSALSVTSENPVQNKVVQAALAGKQDTMTIDTTLSSISTNPIQNKVVQAALAGKQDTMTIDTELSATSTNPVQNKVIKNALDNVNITLDTGLSQTSENAVQNKVVALKIAELEARINNLLDQIKGIPVSGVNSSSGVEISSSNALTSDFIADGRRDMRIEIVFSCSILTERLILVGDYPQSGHLINLEIDPRNLGGNANTKVRLFINDGDPDYYYPQAESEIEIDKKYTLIWTYKASTSSFSATLNGNTIADNVVATGMNNKVSSSPLKIGSDYRTSFKSGLKIYSCTMKFTS